MRFLIGRINCFGDTRLRGAFFTWLIEGIQQFFQLGNGSNPVIGTDGTGVLAQGRHPAGSNSGVDSAQDIGREAVAHHDAAAAVKVRNLGEAGVKVVSGGLVEADFLGHEDLLKPGIQPRAGEAAVLDGGGAVAGQEQTEALM